jgi:hypothetical protein
LTDPSAGKKAGSGGKSEAREAVEVEAVEFAGGAAAGDSGGLTLTNT